MAINIAAPGGSAVALRSALRGSLGDTGQERIRYVDSATGSDSNDGLSWFSPKETILAAYDSIDQYGGTIYFTDMSHIGGEVDRQGIWIIGSSDPSYGSPPAGWRLEKPMHFIGVGGLSHAGFGEPACARIRVTVGGEASNDTDPNKPFIWIAGSASKGIKFTNVAIIGAKAAVKIGFRAADPTNVDCMSALIWFKNFQARTPTLEADAATCKPLVHIGRAFWIYFEDTALATNPFLALDDTDRACIRVSSPQSYLIDINRGRWSHGGVIFDYHGASCNVRNVTIESDFVSALPPAVWIKGYDPALGGPYIENTCNADAGAGSYRDVEVTGAGDSGIVYLSNSPLQTGVRGRATNLTDALPEEGQTGISRHHTQLVGRSYAAPRAFGPGLNPSQLALKGTRGNPTPDTGMVITTGVIGPDGRPNAYNVSDNGTGNEQIIAAFPTRPSGGWSVGDHVACGVWVRTLGTFTIPGFAGLTFCQFTGGVVNQWQDIEKSGQTTYFQVGIGSNRQFPRWTWVTSAARMASVAVAAYDPDYSIRVKPLSASGCTIDIFAPVAITVPAAHMSATEFRSWYYNSFLPIDPLTPARAVGTPYGLDFAVNGSLLASGPIRGGAYTVATVPSASTAGAGAEIYVSDGNAGAACKAVSDGTAWKVVPLGPTIATS